MDISAVRIVIAEAAGTVVLPAGTLTSSWFLPDAVTEPHFFVAEYEQTFDRTHRRGLDDVQFTCRALIGHADERSAQFLMDQLFAGSGPTSLKAAIEAIRGPGGALAAAAGEGADLQVQRTQANRLYEHAGAQYIGGELTVRVLGPGG